MTEFNFGVNNTEEQKRAQVAYPMDAESKGALKAALEDILKEVIIRSNRVQFTIATGATTFSVASNYMVLTAAAGVTIASITGGREGMILTLQFTDANVTITDTGTGAADTVNLDAAFTSAANAILQLIFDGTSWREVGRGIVGGVYLPLAGGTMTGAITLGENASVALDPAGSADGKYTGITVTGTGGTTIAFGDLIYLDPTDSRWELCDANSASGADGDSRGIIGMAVSTSTDGAAVTVLLHGIIRADAVFPAMTVNAPMYVSETAGDITGTQPVTTDVVIRIVGVAITADELFFNPDFSWTTHT